MITVYGIPNCNSVKKAIDWLKANNIEYHFHNYKKEGITHEKLRAWAHYFGWQNLLNKAGTTWKNLPEKEKYAVDNEAAAIEFMKNNTSVIKRPLVEYAGTYLLRFNEEEYKKNLLP